MADDGPTRRTLLVLDEDHEAASKLDAAFRGDGARVEQVADLEEADSYLRDTFYHVVVVDLDLLGDEGVPEVKDVASASTFVALAEDEDAAEDAMADGADDYLVAGDLDGDVLDRVRRYAYERSRLDRALSKSEDKFETLVESIEDGYFEVDLSGTFRYVNDYMCRRSGYDEEEMVGTSYVEFVDEDNAEKLFNAFHVLYETGIPLKVLDFEAIRKDGERIDVETSVFLKRDLDGRKVGFWGILRDVTARKQLESEVEKLRAREG